MYSYMMDFASSEKSFAESLGHNRLNRARHEIKYTSNFYSFHLLVNKTKNGLNPVLQLVATATNWQTFNWHII